MNNKHIFSFLILVSFLIIFAQVQPTSAYGEGVLEGWDYRKKITISGATGAGTNYPVKIEGSYYNQLGFGSIVSNFSDFAHQGVTQDTFYVYTTNTTSVTKYSKTGVLQDSSTVLDYTDMTSLSDLCVYDDYLYIAAHDAPSTNSTIIKFTTDLEFVYEYDIVEPDVANCLAAASISYHEGYFYTIADTTTDNQDIEVLKWTTSFIHVENWTIDCFSITGGTWHYQGIDWLNDYIIMPVHEDAIPETVDVYYFDGSEFRQVTRLNQFWWDSDGNTYQSSQGISIEEYFGTYYAWFASRGDVEGQVLKARITLNPTGVLSFEQHCKSDFSDVRITASDGETVLDYWIEDYSSYGVATFWVNVTENLNTSKALFAYFGNDDATSLSDGDSVFSFYNDYSSGALDASDWDIIDDSGTISFSTTNAKHGYVAQVQGDNTATKYFYQSNLNFTYGYAIRFRSLLESTVAANQITQQGWGLSGVTSAAYINSYHGTDRTVVCDGEGNYNITTESSNYFDLYRTFEITRNGTGVDFFSDDLLFRSVDNQPDNETMGVIVYCRDAEYDLYNDWSLVRKFVSNEPEVTSVGALTTFNLSAYQATINGALFFLGLALVPSSTVYLVSGGRDSITMNKVFYFILMFFIGWGLILGVL